MRQHLGYFEHERQAAEAVRDYLAEVESAVDDVIIDWYQHIGWTWHAERHVRWLALPPSAVAGRDAQGRS